MMSIDKIGKIAYTRTMLTDQSLLGRRLALECRYDGPLPRRPAPDPAPAEARFPPLFHTVRALAHRRRRLPAALALRDPALLRMGRYLTRAVFAMRAAG